MKKKKIFNDPVYGFVTIPYGILFDLVEHPYFQRLRRISQLGLTHYVYPGALHTRFHHALGALHLMTQAIEVLRSKGVEITEAEAEAVSIAILLHDIGHGPFSHALEHKLVKVHHEDISLLFMQQLNEEFGGKLSLAIQIFTNQYSKRFLNQLIIGQLDMDRMDYLNRDSFFTGVSEGVIGYDRIIKMLDVRNGVLVVEEKGLYSIEKFLVARRLMYWQVYLHKTSFVAEHMLIRLIKRVNALLSENQSDSDTGLVHFLQNEYHLDHFEKDRKKLLDIFASIDDIDVLFMLKQLKKNNDFIAAYLSKSLINRRLFKVEVKNSPFECDYVGNIRQKVTKTYKGKIKEKDINYLVFEEKESNIAYSTLKAEINILSKRGKVVPMSEISDYKLSSEPIEKYYLCYPKKIL